MKNLINKLFHSHEGNLVPTNQIPIYAEKKNHAPHIFKTGFIRQCRECKEYFTHQDEVIEFIEKEVNKNVR
jgi:hypothetical protein